MNIEDLTVKQIREVARLVGCASPGANSGPGGGPVVGTKVFIRTVTHYYTGRVSCVDDFGITLDEAAWVADTGRFADALKSGTLKEVEPFPSSVTVAKGAIVDFCSWDHELPRAQK